MKHYGYSASIPYLNKDFEVTGVEFCDWEDKVQACVSNPESPDDKEVEWVTYDYLLDLGYFNEKPPFPRPDTLKSDTEGVKLNGMREVKPTDTDVGDGAAAAVKNPGFRETRLAHIHRDTTEWTPAKILKERARLLKLEEKIVKAQEKALEFRKTKLEEEAIRITPINPKFYNPDGTEYSLKDWIILGIVVAVIISLIVTLYR